MTPLFPDNNRLKMVKAITLICVGVLLIASWVDKLVDPSATLLSLKSVTGLHSKYLFAIALVTAAAEVTIGLALILYRTSVIIRLAQWLFITYTLYLFYLTTFANPPACGCPVWMTIFSDSKNMAISGMLRNTILICILACLDGAKGFSNKTNDFASP